MKSLTVDIYRIVFRISKIKPLAFAFSLIYMSVLNFIVLHALGLLMEGWIAYFSIVHRLFAFPYSILTALAVAGGTFALMPSQSNITKAAKREGSPWLLIAYTLFGVGLYLFMRIVFQAS